MAHVARLLSSMQILMSYKDGTIILCEWYKLKSNRLNFAKYSFKVHAIKSHAYQVTKVCSWLFLQQMQGFNLYPSHMYASSMEGEDYIELFAKIFKRPVE